MYRIQEMVENTIIIEKSEFITRLYRVNSVEEVNAYLEYIRKKHYDATHNCYAYILGDNQDIQKSSDDGEPQKTAGAPMMDVLKKNNMTNILAITTRYFGGILLGAGGLIRAYSSSVSDALKKAQLFEPKAQNKIRLTTSYQGYNTILKVMPYITIDEVSFTDSVIITGYLDLDKYESLESELYKYKVDFSLSSEGVFDIEIPKSN